MRKSILFLSFLLCFNSSFSQDKKKKLAKFSEGIPGFLEEINDFLNSKKNKDLSRVFSQFEENINAQKFDSKNTKQIIAVSNKMLTKQLRPNPHFSNFLKAINQFAYQQSAIPKFSNWLNVADNLLEESTTKRLMLYFIFTDDFLSSIDEELSKGMNVLHEAEALREANLKAINRREQTVESETVRKEVAGSEIESLIEERENMHVEPVAERKEVIQPEVVDNSVKPEIIDTPVKPEIIDKAIKKEAQTTASRTDKKETVIPERVELLRKSGFDQRLEAIEKKAHNLEHHGHKEAAREARSICRALINHREDFIKGEIDNNVFAQKCECSVRGNIKYLSQSRGVLGAFQRVIKAIFEAIKGTSTLKEASKTSMQRISNIKESLKTIRDTAENPQESNTPKNTGRPS